MEGQHENFIKGLRYEPAEEAQKDIAKESIKKELFKILNDIDSNNGDTINLEELVERVSNKLGLQENKSQVLEYVTQIFQTGRYRYKLTENGNIQADFSTADILQKKSAEKDRGEAEAILSRYVQRTEEFAEQLSNQKVKVTEITLKNLFAQEEKDNNGIWIDLAIEHVIENQSQEK